jgi:hypothetical protein
VCSIQRKRVGTVQLLLLKLGATDSRVVSGACSPGIIMSNQRDSSTIYKLNVNLNLEDHYETHSHTR